MEFRLGNLLEPASYERIAPVDVLFCRNVLIYFSDVTTTRAVRVFHSVLAPVGTSSSATPSRCPASRRPSPRFASQVR